jgi:hypothetical protein
MVQEVVESPRGTASWPHPGQRKVSESLTVLNDLMIWLLEDTPATRRLIGHYIDVWEHPDRRI